MNIALTAFGGEVREVHCNTCEGAHTALCTFLRCFQGVHKAYLACYLAVYEAVRNAKRITPEVTRRLCFGTRLHTSWGMSEQSRTYNRESKYNYSRPHIIGQAATQAMCAIIFV